MYKADSVGRIWLDKDSFLAPFGRFRKDWEYVYKYFQDPKIAKRLFHDGMDFNSALAITESQLRVNPSFIGFYKNKRSAYLVLEQITVAPKVFVLHGGISRNLYGSGLPQKAFDYAKQFVFKEMEADKLEGIVMHPNKILEGYFQRGGLVKDCEIRGRISVDKELFPIKIFGMTKEEYQNSKDKEKDHGRITPKTKSRPNSTRSGSSTNRCSKKGTRKAHRRKKHKRK